MGDIMIGTGHNNLSGLQRLTQWIINRSSKLHQFIQKQHPSMCYRYFSESGTQPTNNKRQQWPLTTHQIPAGLARSRPIFSTPRSLKSYPTAQLQSPSTNQVHLVNLNAHPLSPHLPVSNLPKYVCLSQCMHLSLPKDSPIR